MPDKGCCMESNEIFNDEFTCDYGVDEMKIFMKALGIPKRKREMCNAGIEMFLFNKDDILFIASHETTERMASDFLHRKIMAM